MDNSSGENGRSKVYNRCWKMQGNLCGPGKLLRNINEKRIFQRTVRTFKKIWKNCEQNDDVASVLENIELMTGTITK